MGFEWESDGLRSFDMASCRLPYRPVCLHSSLTTKTHRMARSARNSLFDYVVVGAGSAGCTMAHRLTEDAGTKVLVLEAGGWDRHPLIHIPLGFGRIVGGRFDWSYVTEPQAAAGQRRIENARGRVVGGSSSINAMAHVRGHRSDYERWARSGLAEWSYAHALPYFRRQESWEGGETFYRGGQGPIGVRKSVYRDAIIDAFEDAGRSLGHPHTDDYNGPQQEGFCTQQMTIRDGRRSSAASAYLRPALSRGNLSIRVEALITRLLIENGRAVGVEYRCRGETFVVRARREVILAAGVINTPQILLLSGIGDPDELKTHGIRVTVPLRGVGRNLQDHVAVGLAHARRQPGPFHRMMRADRLAVELLRAQFTGRGLATDLPTGGIAFVRGHPDEPAPDIQVLSIAAPYDAYPYFVPFRKPYRDVFVLRAVLLRPESRGFLKLASADPSRAMRIDPNMLTRDRDWQTLRSSVRLLLDIARQPALQRLLGAPVGAAPGDPSEAAIDAHIRSTAVTFRHTLGTCRMGLSPEDGAVVDAELRVFGVEGLRVVDASVMPDLVGGNINAAVVMIAEKAADLIRGRPPLPPAPDEGTYSFTDG